MIDTILAPLNTGKSDQYHLPSAHRQSILAQSDSTIACAEIERKRQAFIKLYGDEFGTGDAASA